MRQLSAARDFQVLFAVRLSKPTTAFKYHFLQRCVALGCFKAGFSVDWWTVEQYYKYFAVLIRLLVFLTRLSGRASVNVCTLRYISNMLIILGHKVWTSLFTANGLLGYESFKLGSTNFNRLLTDMGLHEASQ